MDIIVTTACTIEGYLIKEYKGIVHGIIVRSPTISQGFFGGLATIAGGDIDAYTDMCEQARQKAFDLLVENAKKIGGNAVISLRYDTTEVVSESNAIEVFCYGTAVIVEPESK